MQTRKMNTQTTAPREKQAMLIADPMVIAAVIVELREDVAELRRRVDRRPPRLPTIAGGWVSLKEAAYQTRYGKESVRIWAASGQVIAKRCGGKWFVDLASVRRRIVSVQNSVRHRAKFR